jgi:hypothetical protein
MHQYLMSVHHDDDNAIPEGVDFADVVAAVGRFNAKLQAVDALVFGGGLTPASSATVVDATGPEVIVTDGPYLETREYLGGFWVIRAADLDAALAWAREASAACMGTVEVRPFQDEPE